MELLPLRQAYLADLPQRALDQERLLVAACQGEGAAREELVRHIHRVAGSAGTYGYAALSRLASRLERALRDGEDLVEGAALHRELVSYLALLRDPRARSPSPAPSRPRSGSLPPAPSTTSWGAVAPSSSATPAPAGLLRPRWAEEQDPAKGPQRWLRSALLLGSDLGLAAELRDAGVRVTLLPLSSTQEAILETAFGEPGRTAVDLVILDAPFGVAPTPPALVDILRRLRFELPTGTPLLFLTELADLTERVLVTGAGASLCLRKPVSGAALLRTAQVFAPGPYAGCSVLIVDDDPQVVELVRALLNSCRLKVVVASDPQGFWAALEKERPSLVLMDISLPTFTGFELCRAAKADLRFRDLPVVFLSARLSVEDRTAAFAAGADDYIPKPIAPAEFLARVTGRLRSTIEARERAREREETLATLAAQHRLLQEEQERSERLLLNILPGPIAARLKRDSHIIADAFPDVTVLFADIVGFTRLSASSAAAPEQIVGLLNELFSGFDRLAARHGLEKIKTIGDAYMVVGGLPTPRPDHAEAVAAMALAMQAELHDRVPPLLLRIGIHSGPVVAGVIGTTKFSYDVWGGTVNTASRMESHGLAGAIQVSEEVHRRLAGRFRFQARGRIPIKDMGEMATYLLLGAL